MGLLVLKPGHFTTIQDQGRAGHREWGVPSAGAFDLGSLAIANGLLGNEPKDAALELTLLGGVYEAKVPLALALAGAPMKATLIRPGRTKFELFIPQSFSVEPGDQLQIGGTTRGARTYLAVRGGWRTSEVLGSRSTESRLESGTLLPALSSQTLCRRISSPPESLPGECSLIRVLRGPDAGRASNLEVWARSCFQVTPACDRMGLRLEGPVLELEVEGEPLSGPVTPGSVQIAGGQMLILGVSCGTMGGYPQVANVISSDLGRLGQLRQGDKVQLQLIELEEARAIDLQTRLKRRAMFRRIAHLVRDLDVAKS